MNFLKKLIIPLLLIILIGVTYTTYFSGNKELGSFANFDTNNNANKEIRVKVIKEKGFNIDEQNGLITFYAADKNGIEFLVQAPYSDNFNSVDEVILNGHLHPDHFHATELVMD